MAFKSIRVNWCLWVFLNRRMLLLERSTAIQYSAYRIKPNLYYYFFLFIDSGGRSGIRTHGPREGTTVFKTAAFNRSAILPSYVFALLKKISLRSISHLRKVGLKFKWTFKRIFNRTMSIYFFRVSFQLEKAIILCIDTVLTMLWMVYTSFILTFNI